jgi:ribonuclease HI
MLGISSSVDLHQMQRRLDDFFRFQKGSGTDTVFNPFSIEIRENPKLTEDVIDHIARGNERDEQRLQNMLDAPPPPEGQEAKIVPLFPQPKANPEPLPEINTIIPMDQPRDKNGQRRLYTHPNLPRVGAKGEYFLLVGHSDKSADAWLLQFDGAANPNPGPASSGAVLWSPKGIDGQRKPVFEMGKYLGRATNNISEAQGMLLGLKMAAMRGARELLIEGDSELIIFQHIGKYRVKDKNIRAWWGESQAAMMDETCFDWIAIRQVPREFNERADSITKEVLSRKEGFSRHG